MAIYFKRLIIIDIILVAFCLLLSMSLLNRYLARTDPNDDLIQDDTQNPSEEIVPLRLNSSPDRMLLEVMMTSRTGKILMKDDQRLNDLLEVKPPSYCANLANIPANQQKVTLIADFNDYQFYDLKNTIGSLQVTNSWDLIEEFIIVDDASALEYIRNDAYQYLSALPKVRFLRGRHIEPIGTTRSRALAARQAKSDIIVFLDSKTLVTRGWLQPLIDVLHSQKSILAVPHYDLIKDPVSLNYHKTPRRNVATFTWNLSINMRIRNSHPFSYNKSSNATIQLEKTNEGDEEGDHQENEDKERNNEAQEHTRSTPVLRGNVFAVRKEYFYSIGGYDETLEDVGAAHLELSFRVWQCGGQILIISCSRVGVLDLEDPVAVSSHSDVIRIAGLWFGDHKSALYTACDISRSERMIAENSGLAKDIERRRRSIEARHQCRTIDWYLQTVALTMVIPSRDAVRFGVLRVNTGRCSRLLKTMRVKLDECQPEHFNQQTPETMFEMTRSGQLKVMGKCLTVKNNAYILAEDCRTGDWHQIWRYSNEQLVNSWSKYCAMHVTDPDKATEGDRQIAMAQICGTDPPTSSDSFKIWEFIIV